MADRDAIDPAEVCIYAGAVADGAFQLTAISSADGLFLGVGATAEGWRAAIHPDDLASYDEAFERFLRGVDADIDYRVRTARGLRVVWDRVRLVRRNDGAIEAHGILVDVTERAAPTRIHALERDRLTRLLDTLDGLVVECEVVDGTWRAVYANEGVRSLLDLPAAGSRIELHPVAASVVHPDDRALAGRAVERARAGEDLNLDLRLRAPHGHASYRIRAVTEPSERGVRVTATAIDLSDWERLDHDLTMAQDLFGRTVARAGPVDERGPGMFLYSIERDPDGKLVAFRSTGGMEEFTGPRVRDHDDPTEHWRAAIVTEDRDRITDQLDQPAAVVRYRVRHPSGATRLVEDRYRRTRYTDGHTAYEGAIIAVDPVRTDEAAATSCGSPLLTDRQREVLGLLCEGVSSKEIARRLRLSEVTVRNHIGAMSGRLGVHSRAEAVAFAYRHGFVARRPRTEDG